MADLVDVQEWQFNKKGEAIDQILTKESRIIQLYIRSFNVSTVLKAVSQLYEERNDTISGV